MICGSVLDDVSMFAARMPRFAVLDVIRSAHLLAFIQAVAHRSH